jgi:membrane protein DedA with SNARE-associated domain
VLLFVAIESTGIPFPGETMLLAAAIYAGTMQRMSLLLVIVAAAAGAIFGDNVGFIFLRRNEHRLEDEAEKALPGPLDAAPSINKGDKSHI